MSTRDDGPRTDIFVARLPDRSLRNEIAANAELVRQVDEAASRPMCLWAGHEEAGTPHAYDLERGARWPELMLLIGILVYAVAIRWGWL